MMMVPDLLAELARALVERSTPERWRVPDGTALMFGPMNPPFETLYVLVFDGADATERIGAFLSGRSGLGDFVAIADLTQEVGRPALLVERVGNGSHTRSAA